MIKRLLLAAALSAAASGVQAAGTTYTLDPTHTLVIASWNHLGYSNPSATFSDISGTLVYDPDDVSRSSVDVTLPLSGLDAFSAKFNAHLANADFFESARFPQATFRSTRVQPAGEGRLRVTGELTIKGIARPVVLDVVLNKRGEGRHGGPQIGFDATGTVKRSDFGMGMAAPAVSDEVALRITAEATAPKPGTGG